MTAAQEKAPCPQCGGRRTRYLGTGDYGQLWECLDCYGDPGKLTARFFSGLAYPAR